jgi:hypothetical protein
VEVGEMKLFELRNVGNTIHFRALRKDEGLPSNALLVLSGPGELKGASGFSAIVCSERYILPSLCVLCGGSPSSLSPSVEWLDYPSPFHPSALPTDREELRKVVMGFPMADALHRSIVSKAGSEPLPIVELPAERLRERLERVLRKEADLADLDDVGSLNLDPRFLLLLKSVHLGSVDERKGFLGGLLSFAESNASEIVELEAVLKARMVVMKIYPVPSAGTAVLYVSPFASHLGEWPGEETRVAVVASSHEREATRLGYLVAPLVLVLSLSDYSRLWKGGIPVVLWRHDQWVLKDRGKRAGEGGGDKEWFRESGFVRSETEMHQFLFKVLGLERGR